MPTNDPRRIAAGTVYHGPGDPRVPNPPANQGLEPIPTRLSADAMEAFLRSLPGMTSEGVEEALAHPNGFMGTDPDGNWFVAYRLPDGSYSIEQIAAPYEKSAKEKNRMSTKPAPCLIVGPVLVSNSPPPRGPQRAKSLIDEILERRGEYLLSANREPFHGTKAEIDQIVAEALAANPGARLAGSGDVRLALSEKMNRAEGRQPKPKVAIAANAQPVTRSGRIEGTISRQSLRESISASEAQAQEVADRVRAKQAADPTLKASAQRSDGSYFREDGTPHQDLSMSRQPADRDPHPGLGPAKVRLSELSGAERKLIEGVVERTCLTQGCNTKFASATRKFCQLHGFNSGRRLGLKSE